MTTFDPNPVFTVAVHATQLPSQSATEKCVVCFLNTSVLEFGGGTCLFARGFLLAFSRICEKNGRDYHQRLTYVVADRSEPMLCDAQRYGVFPPHSRVLLAQADAIEQRFDWLDPPAGEPLQFDAIFLNYLLDCLPATVLRSPVPSMPGPSGCGRRRSSATSAHTSRRSS